MVHKAMIKTRLCRAIFNFPFSIYTEKMSRKVEVFTGAYASGKSETSINRALQHIKRNEPVTLVDLDTVEPAYTLRPLVKALTERGINVIAQTDYFGLGEAASYVTAKQLNCLDEEGDIIIDVGYGASGLDVLDIINNIEREENLNIYLVINTSKFETSSVENILEYIEFASGLEKRDWKKFTGIISNTHFGSETTKEDIIRGYDITKEAAQKVGLPIVAIGVSEELKNEFDSTYDGVEIWFYERLMPNALW